MKKLLLFSLFALLASAMGWAATETWTKVTSTPNSWDGDYLIVYEADNLAFDGSLTKLDAANNTKSVTISDGTITTTNCDFYFTIASKTGGFSIKSKSGLYIGNTKTGKKINGLDAGSTDSYTNTLSVTDGVATITSTKNSTILKYNDTSDQKRFRYYSSGQKSIALYKKQEAPATKVADVTVSPAFGDIAKGTVVKISCATKGAVLNGTVGKEELNGAALPYTYTASELGALKVEVYASKDGFEDSEVREGIYNVCQPKVAALEITPGFGTIEVGTKVTISCATEGAVLKGYVGEDTYVENAQLPYTFTAEKEGEISVYLSATKEGYDDSKELDGTFIVKAAVPVAYSDVITAKDLGGKGSYDDVKNVEKGGAKYKVAAYVTTNIMQFNKGKNAGLVMTTAQAAASKLIITWNKPGSGKPGKLEIYGKNTPYSAITDLNDNEGELIESVSYSADGTTVDLGGNYTFIGIKPTDGVTYVTSFEFIWNEGAAGGADVTYTKASEAKAGNFAVLATADGKAVGRNADLSPVNVTVSGDAIGLAKGQTAIDEFEIKENGNNYQLYGGLASNGSRRYLTYDATGVTTVATADDNANVTFESKTAAGLLVKFNDGQYLMFNGTKFIKADYGEAVVQAEGETLTPVIVFMSSSNVSTGVETVEFDENAEAQYFNLNGVQVKAENLTPGLYIVRQGNKVSKQVIR